MLLTTPSAAEYPFIMDSWARSFMKSPWAGCIPNSMYADVSRACISEIIDRGAEGIVAVEGEGESRRVCGYFVTEPRRQILHFVYTKRDLRGLGIGRKLLEYALQATNPSDWTYTHKTKASDKFCRGMSWDPRGARVKAK